MTETDSKRDYDRRRGSARKRGYTRAWDVAATAFKRENSLCVMCAKEGRWTPVFAVDHIIPHKGDPKLFWERSNWQSLCERHHNRDKRNLERGFRVPQAVGADGWPIE
ncbi:HNH endonuclease [Bradyrhizobium yuanmingense]|uniref:HNH endonuclease n=1 Tax=Bradyrhizobium yuanmingense TaxID=108015 RepID=UPI0023B89972|nr:HNH endonuclease signature motif containing protein [Bradyrhizobium yuanmingense]MDF0581258.1 HNH endonuclease signature motif containing protein [Bradyrhizobium yuanmingense]